MSIFTVSICAASAVVFGALIKRSNKEYALIMSVAACIVIFLAALNTFSPLTEQIKSLVSISGYALSAVLKAVGIALVAQLMSNICKDADESALSFTVELSAKVAILVVALPLLTDVFEYLEEILKM